jgi:predicted ATPase|tara:strand:- start:156 stop:884 length:729 start_codon:yes stop_codon:yes gene_type:complete
MRIAFSGTGNSGKTTLLKSFLHTWTNYTTPEKTYRDIIEEKNLDHSSNTTTETQSQILDFMVDQLQLNEKDDKVVYDRCPLDNIAYSMWCNDKNVEGFTKKFTSEQIALMKESMRKLDIIFLCRFDETQAVQDDGFRDTDVGFIKEIDNIFNSLYNQYVQNPEADIFFPKGDTPCILPLPNQQQQRIDLISEYVTPDGEMYDDEESVLNANNLNQLEDLLTQQKASLEQENKEKDLRRKFGI